ncbi:hypothetical protein ASE74_23225 [Pedobacter sp. Leaf216]|nr:hypothetical protein ASE74_23225 [Pedobacter sp. Leaf216]
MGRLVILKFSFAVPSGRFVGRKKNGMFFFRSVGMFGVFCNNKGFLQKYLHKKKEVKFLKLDFFDIGLFVYPKP